MPFLARTSKLGKLRMVEVYEVYDIPRLFCCANDYGHHFLVLSIDENNLGHTWLYVAVTRKTLKRIRCGEIDLRDAFKSSEEGCLLLVSTGADSDEAKVILPESISDDVLPVAGESLSFPKSRKIPEVALAAGHAIVPGRPLVPANEIDLTIEAFLAVRGSWSVDKLVADPALNAAFVKRCRELGVGSTTYRLNRQLMRLRKSSALSGLGSERYTLDKAVAEKINHASELALRYLTLTKAVSLDEILCSPDLRKEFDTFAALMSPGYAPLDYRWAALQVRKGGRHQKISPAFAGKLRFTDAKPVRNLRKKDMPLNGGLYLFLHESRPLFVNQADSLRGRLESHLEYTSSRGLPEWLWPWRKKSLKIAIAELPGATKTVRDCLESDMVRGSRPVFNVPRGKAG